MGTTVNTDKDVNGHTYTGGRATVLWQATDRLTLSLMGAAQTLEEDGDGQVNVIGDVYTQYGYNVPVPRFSEDKFDLLNLVAEYDFDWAALVASYSHSEGDFERQIDFGTSNRFFTGIVQSMRINKEGDVFEVRVSSQLEGPLQFISGLYYEDFELQDDLTGEWFGSEAGLAASIFNPVKGGLGPNGLLLAYDFPISRTQTLEQKAIFGELVYSLNDQWELSAGARRFDYDRKDINRGNYFGGDIAGSEVDSSESGNTFKANVSFTPSDDALMYLQWSEGFRVGHGQILPPISTCPVVGNLSANVDSDSTTNVELGSKLTLADRRLTVNATLYRVDWDDIPVRVFDPTPGCGRLGADVNGGQARSQGFELETVFNVSNALQLSMSASFTDTEFLDDGIAKKGERLPLAPRVNGVVGIDYNFDLAGYNAFIRSDLSYMGGIISAHTGSGLTIAGDETESYSLWNMRAGIEVDQWLIEFFGDNLSDENSIAVGFNAEIARRISPRTLGFEVGYTF